MSSNRAVPAGPEGLSCYTANLAVYLDRSQEDAFGYIARSVRLAVRPDPRNEVLAFSHHQTPLDVLDDGGRLEYRGADDVGGALDAISDELDRFGQCLVVANTAFLDWSTADLDAQAPHLLLVDGRRQPDWHVVDRFTALLPSAGEQRPFSGWITSEALSRYLTPIFPLPPEQRLRNALAFGFPRPLPRDGQYQWVSRTDPKPRDPDRLEAPWVADADAALAYVAEFWTAIDRRPARARLFDDLWAAAQHHAFRYTHVLAGVAGDEERVVLDRARLAWRDLPMAIRFAVDSAKRGRHRPALVARTFAALRRVENEAMSLQTEGEQHGRALHQRPLV
jgi:hypothetical protein